MIMDKIRLILYIGIDRQQIPGLTVRTFDYQDPAG